MQIKLAKKYGFCFGVKRAIKLAERNPGAITFGPLIHNEREIKRLEDSYNVFVQNNTEDVQPNQDVIIRTHGITKQDLKTLQEKGVKITDATCPFVIKPQRIAQEMSEKGYVVVIFGDASHPEIKGVMSYSVSKPIVVASLEELKELIESGYRLPKKVALISQTTKQTQKFLDIANFLISHCYEARVFNTICNATFDNQEAVRELSSEVDVMVIVGGKTSSNTKQLLNIAQLACKDSYLVQDEKDLDPEWFVDKKLCGIAAGASTPDWIVQQVCRAIEKI